MSEGKQAAGIKYIRRERLIPELRVKATENEEAQRLITWARNNNVPIEEDPLLLQILISLDLLEDIPEELHQALIEVYEWFYEQDNLEEEDHEIYRV